MILIALTTCRKYIYPKISAQNRARFNRMESVLNTWWPDTKSTEGVTGKIIVGKHSDASLEGDNPDFADLILDCPDDYRGLALKTIRSCEWAYEHGFEYMVRADDDTCLDVRGVKNWIERKRPDYGGLKYGDCIHGGTGIVFSRKALAVMSKATWFPTYMMADDIWFARVLQRRGIPMYTDAEFEPLSKHCKSGEEMKQFYASLGDRARIEAAS